jgi:hypothetical protein
MPSFKVQPADEDFLATAPKRWVGTFDIPRPAASVWLALTRDGSLDFCRMLGGAEWTSPRPFGVGTTRQMRVALGAIVVQEAYFRWEEGRRKSFYVYECNLPVFNRVAEDYLVEETGPERCRFTWTLAGEPSAAGRPGAPLNAFIARSIIADMRRHFGAS